MQKFSRMWVDGLVRSLELTFTSGRSADSFFVSSLYNALDNPRRFIPVFEMATRDRPFWRKLAIDASAIFVADGMLIAVYEGDASFPFHRFYGFVYGSADPDSIEALLRDVPETTEFEQNDVSARYSKPNEIDRANEWLRRHRSQLAPAIAFAEGRLANTAVTQAVIVRREDGDCGLCGRPATKFVSSTVGTGPAVLYSANTCEEHYETAKAHPTILHFVMSLFNIGLDPAQISMSPKIPEAFFPVLQTLLECELDGASSSCKLEDDGQATIAVHRQSGFRIVLRLKTLMDYAYMIFFPKSPGASKDRQYSRIDSAAHHQNRIQFHPDHIHLAPQADNSVVQSSFTYGMPLLDLPIIKRLVEEAEALAAQG